MANTIIETSTNSNTHFRVFEGIYWLDDDIGVFVFQANSGAIQYSRTTNGGTSWSETTIEAGDCFKASCWFDKETPGDTGDILHICYYDKTDEYVRYVDYNISTDTLGTPVSVVTSLSSFGIDGWVSCAITKSVSGNLYIHYVIDGTYGFYRSTNDGASWTSRTNVYDVGVSTTSPDNILLFPADTSDNNDIAAFYHDTSANEMSIKMYDDSANSWTESSILGSLSSNVEFTDLDGAIRLSDGHLIVAFYTGVNGGANTIECYDITLDSIASPTITNKTEVVSNTTRTKGVAVIINQQNDDIYVGYIKDTTTFNDDGVIYYKKSTNGASTWGSETAYSESTVDFRRISGGRTVTDEGGRIQWLGWNIDNGDTYINLVNDIEITPDVGNVLVIQDGSHSHTTDNLTISYSALNFIQEGFRFRNDDGSESSATWKASQDTNINLSKNQTVRLRTLIDTSGNPGSKNFKLQYKRKDESSDQWRDI